MNACMIVERSNIVIDGAGHTLRGDGTTNGISLSYVNNVTIMHLNIGDFFDCCNNGIVLRHSLGNTITENTITNNWYGIGVFQDSSNNLIAGNNIIGNGDVGIDMQLYSDNTQQVSSQGQHATWSDGSPSGGNYWSTYRGKDANKDGLGDTAYIMDISNEDHYPLMGPFRTFNAGTWGEVSYNVDMISNSTIANFSFVPDDKALYFDVEGENDAAGFCRVSIPKGLMWCDNIAEWTLTVGGTLTEADTIIESGNYTYIYFTYTHSTTAIKIKSTHAYPEPILAWFFLLPLITAFAVLILKLKRKQA